MHRHLNSRHLNYLIAGTVALSALACGDDEGPVPDPELVITTTSLQGGEEGVDYQVEVAATGGTGVDYRWSIADGGLPTGVFLRSEGTPGTVIAGRPRSGGNATFTLRVTDSSGNVATADLSIAITGKPPGVEITTTMLPMGSITQAYSANIEAQNGSGYAWRVLSGELPPGLELSASGSPATLSGTPTTVGRYSFTIRVQDSEGNRDEQQYSVEVVDVRPPLAITPVRLPDGLVSVAYSFDFVASGGSLMGYTWSVVSGELPPGLTLGEEGTPNVSLSGVPTLRGSYSFRLQVRDSEGSFARQSFFVEVAPAPEPLRIVTFEIPNGRVGNAYSAEIRAVNGSAMGYTWSVAQGSLPPGLTLNSGTPAATLEGNPTQAGAFEFVVAVVDSIGSRNELLLRVRIAERIIPVAITATSAVNGILRLPNAEGGQPYDATLQATNGAPLPANAGAAEVRYNWVVTGGELPPGLELEVAGFGPNDDGHFIGVPTALGTYTATVTVFDRLNNTDTQVIQIVVDPPSVPLTIGTTSLDPFASAGCYSDTVSASGGGNADFTWDIAAGSLPPGFTLDTEGTPAVRIGGASSVQSGTYEVTIRVTDTFGLTATQDFTITIDPTKKGDPRWGVLIGDAEVDTRNDIFVTDLCEATPTAPVRVNLTTNPNGDVFTSTRDLAISPSGNAIAFIADNEREGAGDVYLVDLRSGPSVGSAVRIFTANPSSPFQSANEIKWSPDGSKIAIHADWSASGADELWVADVSDLSAPVAAVRVSQIVTSSSFDVGFGDYAFSPDGNFIAYIGDTVTSSRDEAWVVDLRGPTFGAPQKLHADFSSSSMDVNGTPLWAPDSSGVVFNGDLNTAFRDELWFTDVTGAPPYTAVAISGPVQSNGDIPANFTTGYDENYAFSPDGTKFFFVGDAVNDSEDDMFLLDYRAGTFSNLRRVTNLTVSFATCLDGKWSPDSTKIAVRGDLRGSSQDELFIFDITGTLPASTSNTYLRQATTSLEMGFTFWSDYGWSPDGTRVAFIGDFDRSSSDEIFLADITGGPPYTSTKLNPPTRSSAERVNEFTFSPDGEYIAFQGDIRSSFDELFAVDLSGSTPGTAFTVHPPFTSTAFDVIQNTDGFSNSWFWIGDRKIAARGDFEVSANDRVFVFDVSGGASSEGTSIRASNWYSSASSQDIFFFRR